MDRIVTRAELDAHLDRLLDPARYRATSIQGVGMELRKLEIQQKFDSAGVAYFGATKFIRAA
jgi:hypothetical protein